MRKSATVRGATVRGCAGAAALLAIVLIGSTSAFAQVDLSGVFQSIPAGTVLTGGLRNMGTPADISLVPAAVQQMKTVDLAQDPEKMCQPIGVFRMMAREGTKIEVVPALAHGMLVMLFEDLSHGHMRTIYFNRSHPENLRPTWLGDSVGRWEGTTLVVDTVGFNDRTWLNDAGAQHGDALHLVERIRPVLQGKYLEYRVSADDPKALAKPYAYVRYYEKLTTDIVQDICEE